MLGVKRDAVIGKQCSSWGAGICNTDNCGINCLECGKSTTFFNQGGMDFKVYIGFLQGARGKRIGHVEIVEDMTELFKRQRAEHEMTSSITGTIVELSSSASEVAAQTASAAELASKAAELTGSMKENADTGSKQMAQMISAVQEIKESAQTINKVINTINEIAFQTNLLALNASVEAARAGEAGKGFAVVADEVRNLATRSAQAASDTNGIIRTSIEKSELGYRIAGDTAKSLEDILSGLTSANQFVSEIARSSEEQAAAIQTINTSLQRVSDIIEKTKDEGGGSTIAGLLS
jgi:methyl-accepting chemotaxis protein